MTPTDQEQHLWIAFKLAHRTINREMERALASAGLPSLNWYDVLWVVEMSGDKGVWARNLKGLLLFEQSNLSRVLARLVDSGLICETVCEEDRRAKILKITDEGAKLRLRMWAVYGEQIQVHMKKMMADGNAAGMTQSLIRAIAPDDTILQQVGLGGATSDVSRP